MLTQFEAQQIINYERNRIMVNGQRLSHLKEAAIANVQGHPLPPNYPIQLLQQIYIIAIHDMNRNNMYGADRARNRRRNLGNLAITAKLFRDYNNLIQRNLNPKLNYNRRQDGYVGTNIFDDLAYLCFSNVVAYDNNNPLGGPLYNLTDNQVNVILDEMCSSFIEIANAEIAAYNNQQPNNLNQIRTWYRDHRNMPQLFVLTSYHKETIHIQNAIRAINICEGLDLGQQPLTPQTLSNRRALLRCLSIIGEAFTQSNLTPATRNLGFLSRQEFQLFKDIRTKLEHNEWDISTTNIEGFINNNDMQPFIAELVAVRNSLQNTLHELGIINTNDNLKQHYFHQLIQNQNPNNNAANHRFGRVYNFLMRQTQDSRQYNQDRRICAAFTRPAIEQRINIEVQAIINLVRNAPGFDTLYDPHPEAPNSIPIPINIMQDSMNYLIRLNDHYSQAGLNATINNLLHTGIVPLDFHQHPILELPLALVTGLFILARHQQGRHDFLNQHFNQFADALIRYERKLEFIRFLQDNPRIKLALEYHIARIGKFLCEIDMPKLMELLAPMTEPEIRVFRNIIAHDIDVSYTGIPMEALLCRYTAIILQKFPQVQARQNVRPRRRR